MFYWSIYTKHVVKVKKPSTSIIQNIVAVQDSINAAFIQIPSEIVGTWMVKYLRGRVGVVCYVSSKSKIGNFFKENYLNHGGF